MKLSQRERTLLIILGLAIIAIGGYYLILKPQMDTVAKLKTEQGEIQAQYDGFVLAMDSKHPVYKQKTIAETKVRQISALFFPELKQEKFILLLSEQLEAAGIEAGDISFSNVENGSNVSAEEEISGQSTVSEVKVLKDLQGTYLGKKAENPVDLEAAKKEKDEISQLLNNVERQTITLNYNGDIFSFLLFLDTLESYSRRIVVNDVSMNSDGLGRQESSIQLTYYAIPKLYEQDADFMNWTLTGPYGKVDPFYGDFFANRIKTTGKASVKTGSKADFFMMLNPITSDLTTFIMSKMDDRTRESYIYSDNEGPESAMFEVTEKDGKYYYTYQVGGEKYPADLEPAEFIPNGDQLKVQVMSSLRTGSQDLSGVNLTVVNKTNKALVFEIYNDDVKSRIQLVKATGKVSVVKK